MSRYHLSEAYASIYNPRLQEDFNDNLRFIDYMLDEDIEEVVESLFWEFRDYGNSIDEAIELLKASASTEVINESLEILTEARYSARQMQDRAAFRAKQQSDTESTTRTKDAQIRQNQRKARIDGAISRVKAAWKGAAGGLGRAAKAVSSGVSKAGEFVSQQRQAAKAKLQKLVRTGAAKAGQAMRKGSATIERTKRNITGETARAKESRQRISSLSGQRARSTEARKDPWEGSYSGSPSSDRSSTSSGRPALPAARSRAALPPAKEQEAAPVSGRRASAEAKKAKAAKGTVAKGKRMAPPAGSGVGVASKRANTGYAAAAKRFATQAGLKEHQIYDLLDAVIEDLIYEGYATDEYDALDIINTLNEDTLYDITQEYLLD